MDANFWATVAIQGAGIAFFAGVYWMKTSSHEKRLNDVEPDVKRHEGDVSFLYGHLDVPRQPR
jgi:hypothetical protein